MKNFKEIEENRIIYRDKYFFIIKDNFPVNPGHLLIISNEIRKDFFNLTIREKSQLPKVIEKAKEIIMREFNPDGFNIGMNCGEAAGQTIFHFHCHIIPRYKGDIKNPRGGVRAVIPEKMGY